MWKYVTRRIRDTFERSANQFDRCSTTVVNNAPANFADEKEKNKQPCCWFSSRKCWNAFEKNNGTNNRKWRFEHLNKSWMSAITWSSALVLGWYSSQFMHLKLKHHLRLAQKGRYCPSVNDLLASIQPYIACDSKSNFYLISSSKIKGFLPEFIPTVYLISNENDETKNENSTSSTTATSHDSSNDDLGEVLNSIENKLGLAAIEKGHYQDGLSLLRSAANRNHAPAIYNLGLCYENGLGVSANEKTAMELYKSAAALNHPGALYNLGVFYGQGRGGLKSDHKTAARLFRLAAVQGQQNAIEALKTLEIPTSEPSRVDVNNWNYQSSSFLQNENIIPTQSRLFVDHLNYLQTGY